MLPLLRVGSGLVLVIVATLELAGCGTLAPPAPRAAQDYVQVAFGKFASGAFVDELSGKLVKMNCAYHSQDPRMLPGGYSSSRYLAFWAVAPSLQEAASGAHIEVVTPKQQADIIFGLKMGQRIVVYGRAAPVKNIMVLGGSVRTLVLEAHRIELGEGSVY